MQPATYHELSEIDLLVAKFIDKRLPVNEWTHAAHLTVGLWFVSTYGPEEAARKMPDCIYTYNEAVGTKNSDTGGYHETITQFWIWLLNAYWQQVRGSMSFFDACNHLFTTPFADRTAFLKFYSKDLIFSVKARKGYIDPDLQLLDSESIY